MDYEGLSKDLTDQSKVIGSSGKGWGKFAGTNRKAATAIIDLLSRAEVAEARCKAFEKMVREYRDEIVPRYMEKNEAVESICMRCSVLPCRKNECHWYRFKKKE